MAILLSGLISLLAGGDVASGVIAPLRVVTYNIHHGEGMDQVLDLDRIVGVIQALDPDVVCLQEVDRGLSRTDRMDQPSLLAEKLGMAVRFESNYDFDDGHYGNATLTRLPIISSENHALPRYEQREPRGVLRVTVEWEGRKVDVFNTHLGLVPPERLAQAGKLASLLGEHPAVVCGDLNEEVDAPGVALLLRQLEDATPSQDGPAGTIPSQQPRRRIDFVLHSRDFQMVSARIVDEPPAPVASDHLPVVAELQWGE